MACCPLQSRLPPFASVLQYASIFCVGVARAGTALGLQTPSGHLARLLSARRVRRAALTRREPIDTPNATGATSSRNRFARRQHDAPLEGSAARLAGAAP